MNNSEKITGAEYAERLLAINSPTRLIDHLIEKLAAKTGTGWESNLLEFKGSYHKRPDSDDPDSQDCFEWNVMHAFIALANAQGGCVVIGIAETDNHRLVPGDWDPDGILGCRDADGDGKPIPGREEKDLVDHVKGVFFREKFKRNGRTYKFAKANANKPSLPLTENIFELGNETISRLAKLVAFYPCHSESLSCNVLAAIVHPVNKDEDLIEVRRTKKNNSEPVVFYRDVTAKTCELTTISAIQHYNQQREPASEDFLADLNGALKNSHLAIFSTVPAPDNDFHGRSDELQQIATFCGSGRIALIHASGGTGKTQLARKFAFDNKQLFPGGIFLLPMENIKSWAEALTDLITQRPTTTGLAPAKWLGLHMDGDDSDIGAPSAHQDKNPPETHPISPAEIANALIRISQVRGPVLLVLDNLDNPATFFCDANLKKFFLHGLPTGIHIVGTSRTCEGLAPSNAPSVATIGLSDFTEDDAVQILLRHYPFPSRREADAAREIARILGCRALYLRRVARFIEDDLIDEFPTPCVNTLSRLKQNTLNELEDPDDTRTPTVLWHWLKQKLMKLRGGGPKTVRLAEAIADLPADGVPSIILESLWYSEFGAKQGKDILDVWGNASYDRAIRVLIQQNLVSLDRTTDLIHMHRLDHLVIQTDEDKTRPTHLDELSAALAQSPCCAPLDWISFARANAELLKHCPWDFFNGREISSMLSSRPQAAHLISDWQGRLDGSDWAHLLADQPQFASEIKDWSMLFPDDWYYLINHDSNFFDHPQCPRESLMTREVIRNQPVLFSRFNRTELTPEDWAVALTADPSLESYCPWNTFTPDDWFNFAFEHQGQFIDRAIQSVSWASIEPLAWPWLLSTNPRLIDPFLEVVKSDATRIPNQAWLFALQIRPECADQCPFDKFDPDNWVSLLCEDPSWITRIHDPQFAINDTGCLARLLSAQPQLADSFPSDWVAIAREDGDIYARLGTHKLTNIEEEDLEALSPYHAMELIKLRPSIRHLKRLLDRISDKWMIHDLLLQQPQLRAFFSL